MNSKQYNVTFSRNKNHVVVSFFGVPVKTFIDEKHALDFVCDMMKKADKGHGDGEYIPSIVSFNYFGEGSRRV